MKLKDIVSKVKDHQKPAFVRKKWQMAKKMRDQQSSPPNIIRKSDKEMSLFGDKGS